LTINTSQGDADAAFASLRQGVREHLHLKI
jgi:hypothetical protein